MKKLSVIAIALTTTAGSAFAGNVATAPVEPVIVAPVVPVATWEGGYVGAQIGYAYSKFDLGNIDVGDFSENSVIGGLNAGYLWSLGNGWYIGPEFQYDWADLSVTDPDTGDEASFDAIARLKLIVGTEIGTNGLLYGSVGFAYANLSGGLTDQVGDVLDVSSDSSYVLSIGYDYRMNENWAIGAEYLYHDFKDITASGGDVNLNALEVKATYRF
ncbi:outer membrane beta-barrel protein [Sedimentitalea sp. JM2-8]|uniref:Outer membrane beta-barrel protein n=1 Tax=Sedimentitalea xiamensis TaxID=3050037 RepID=A0ABT7FK42_9RHOB|nr:outer membrane beta-barrel protein [Sedimentitalea xiamensis]MDK3075521.1 outer membrane beta-barrel protein [Sedimentitalea xiamensis]